MSCEKCGAKKEEGKKTGYQPVYSTYSDYVTKIFNLEKKVKKLEDELAEKDRKISLLTGKNEENKANYETFVSPAPFKKTFSNTFSEEPEVVEPDEPEQFLATNSPLLKGRKNFRKKSDKRNSREISDNELNEGKIEIYEKQGQKKDFITPTSPLFKGRKHYKWAGSKQTEDEASFEREIEVEEVKKSDEEAEMKFSGKLNQSGRQIQGGQKAVYGEAFENEDGTFGSRVIKKTTSYSTRQRTSSMEATGIITSKRPETKRSTSDDFDAQGFYDYLCELEGKPQSLEPYQTAPSGFKISTYSYEHEPEIVKAKDHKSPVLSWEVIGQERNVVHAKVVMSDNSDTGVKIQEVDEGQICLSCDKCQGFEAHVWRKTCNSCKCPRESHDVYHEEWVNVRERLGLGTDDKWDKWGSRDRLISQGLAWAPPGLPPYKVDQYFKCLPTDKVPKLGSPGEKYREKQLMVQLPKQDLALAYCRHVDPAQHTSYDDFITARNEIALDIAYAKECTARVICPECKLPVNPNDVGVLAPKFGDGVLWHPACFVCSDCKQLLVDLTYCVHDDYLYCERHYAEQLKPRCSACDELIFSGEYTKAMSKDWHSGHFCCWQCDESLTGQRYVLRDDHPYCIKCYESVFANTCDECNKTIGIDSKDLSYKDKHWHEACFFCNKCRVSLVDKQFGSKADKIYCGNCYDAQFASRCDGCGQIFRAGTKKMEYKTRQWHEQCFCCCVCKSAIGTKSFIPREQEIYCATCYEEKFATRCVKCNKIITSGGVTYKNEPWHRECFTCTNCSTSLAGQRFTSRDEKPYCADCFGELFAKRCTACCKPITGIGGTRFISFEDRHWHNDCFICASCKSSLVGRGFITDAEDILCTECAKQKLM